MRKIIKATNISLTPGLKLYIINKLIIPVEKLFSKKLEPMILDIEVERTTKHHKGNIWRAEANLTVGKRTMRAESFGKGLHEAIDLVEDELRRGARQFKEKKAARGIRSARAVKKAIRGGGF